MSTSSSFQTPSRGHPEEFFNLLEPHESNIGHELEDEAVDEAADEGAHPEDAGHADGVVEALQGEGEDEVEGPPHAGTEGGAELEAAGGQQLHGQEPAEGTDADLVEDEEEDGAQRRDPSEPAVAEEINLRIIH